MAFEDKTLVCKDCGKGFIFSAGEQEFFVGGKVSACSGEVRQGINQ